MPPGNPDSNSPQVTSEVPPIHPQPAALSDLEVSAARTSAPGPVNSQSPDRYVIKKFHARGGMGEVWVSEDPQIGREVALKRLASSSPVARERFMAEAQVTGQLEHPGIVPVHDIGVDDAGQPFYIMKLVRGRTLKLVILEFHARCGADPAAELERIKLLQIFIAVCQTVSYGHSRGVLHRDIKPDNIMLGQYGETVLLDWGLAKIGGVADLIGGASAVRTASGTFQQTEDGSVMGSPLYMPPEMAGGYAPETDERTDVYLLGATLYEILTGHPPREGRSRDELLDLARTSAPLRPRKHCKVAKPIEAICMKAMASRKEDRYATVAQLIEDTQRFLAAEPVSVYRENVVERTWRWCKQHRTAIGRSVAAICLLATTTLVLIKWEQLSQRQREASRQAAELQQRENARVQIQSFDRLADEAEFFSASSDSVNEHAPYFEPEKGRAAEEAALAAAADWGLTLEKLPLMQEAPRLRARIYELLLLMAQEQIATREDASALSVQALLDRARQLTPSPSRGYYRLVNELAHQTPPQNAPQDSPINKNAPMTAFDLFLLGEDARRRVVPDDEPGDSLSQRSPDRLANIREAIDDYHRALELAPNHYWAHFQLGRCYLATGRTAEAVEALGTCVALRPDAPWSYSARGMALGLLGQFDQAKADLDHALQLDPAFRPALLNRGAVEWLHNDGDAATADFSAALQPPQQSVLIEAAFYRAQISLQRQDLDAALADLNAAITARPYFPQALMLRARVHLLKTDTDDTVTDLDLLLRQSVRETDNPPVGELLGRRAGLLRDIAAGLSGPARLVALELAEKDVDAALHLGSQSPGLYANRGAIRDSLGNVSGAIEDYSRALQADPNDSKSRINRAWAYQKLADYPDARSDFAVVVAADPQNAESNAGLAFIDAAEGHADAAREEAAMALAGSEDYLVLHNVACVYARLSESDISRKTENQDVAIALLEKALLLWRLNQTGPDEAGLIEQEPAFPESLRNRPEFVALLKKQLAAPQMLKR